MTNKSIIDFIYYIYEILKIFNDNNIIKEAKMLQTEDIITIKEYTHIKLKIQTSSNK